MPTATSTGTVGSVSRQPRPQVFRRHSQEYAQLVAGLADLDFQLGNLGFCLGQGGLGLVGVEFRGHLAFESGQGNSQRFTLQSDVGPDIGKLLFQGAELHIIVATSPSNVTSTSS